MKKNKCETERRSDCAISMALDAIGDKWSLLVMRDLMFSNKRTYTELHSSEERIATNILAARLTMLEANGIIRKSPDSNNGRRILYSLTEKGIDLLPVILELTYWMAKHSPDAVLCSERQKLFETDRQTLIAEYTAQLKAEHL